MGEPKPIATIGVSLGNFYHQSWHSTPRPWSFAVRLTDSSCDFVLKFVSSGHWSICQWENPSDPSALTKGAGPDFANSIRNGKFTFWQIRDSGLVDVIDPNANDTHTHTRKVGRSFCRQKIHDQDTFFIWPEKLSPKSLQLMLQLKCISTWSNGGGFIHNSVEHMLRYIYIYTASVS